MSEDSISDFETAIEDAKCGKGKIMRKGYDKKPYHRKKYRNSRGYMVKEAEVAGSHVEPTCINDRGKPGHSKKILPKPDSKIHLSKYGYSLHKTTNTRHNALKKASKELGSLQVLRRTLLLRNLQPESKNKEILTQDLHYMQKLHQKEKMKKKMIGGDPTGNDLESENKITTYNTVYESKVVCDNGKCYKKNKIRETHTVDGKKIVYQTLDNADTNDILNLEKLDFNESNRELIEDTIKDNDLVVGIRDGDVLQGMCALKLDKQADITYFHANKSYGNLLYVFLKNYVKFNGYDKITITVELKDKEVTDKLNFWVKHGFKILEIKTDRGNYVTMEKVDL